MVLSLIHISFEPDGSDPVNIILDFSKLTQYGSDHDAAVESQDGYKSGVLDSYTIDQNGNIVGVFSNGVTRNLGQIALSRFANPAGLLKEGNSLYSITSNSGSPLIGTATVSYTHLDGIPAYVTQESVQQNQGFSVLSDVVATAESILLDAAVKAEAVMPDSAQPESLLSDSPITAAEKKAEACLLYTSKTKKMPLQLCLSR